MLERDEFFAHGLPVLQAIWFSGSPVVNLADQPRLFIVGPTADELRKFAPQLAEWLSSTDENGIHSVNPGDNLADAIRAERKWTDHPEYIYIMAMAMVAIPPGVYEISELINGLPKGMRPAGARIDPNLLVLRYKPPHGGHVAFMVTDSERLCSKESAELLRQDTSHYEPISNERNRTVILSEGFRIVDHRYDVPTDVCAETHELRPCFIWNLPDGRRIHDGSA